MIASQPPTPVVISVRVDADGGALRTGSSLSRRDRVGVSPIITTLGRTAQCPRMRHSRCELRAEAEPTQDAGEVIGPPTVAQCQCECDCLGIAPAWQDLGVAQERTELVLHVELFDQDVHEVRGPRNFLGPSD
jgi:hypothetical protein